jgi:hypothetical protein
MSWPALVIRAHIQTNEAEVCFLFCNMCLLLGKGEVIEVNACNYPQSYIGVDKFCIVAACDEIRHSLIYHQCLKVL